MNNNKIIIHDKVKKVLVKFTLRASSLEDGKKIIQEAYPEIDVEKNFIYGEEIKELEQGKLF